MNNKIHEKLDAAGIRAAREIDALTWLTTRTGYDQDDLTDDHDGSSPETAQAAVNSIKDAMLLIMALGPQERHDAMTELIAEYGDDNGDCPDELSDATIAGRTANWTWNEGDAWEDRTSLVWSCVRHAAEDAGDQALVEYAEQQEYYWSKKEERW